jgi:hypothetical protein
MCLQSRLSRLAWLLPAALLLNVGFEAGAPCFGNQVRRRHSLADRYSFLLSD